MDDDRPYPNNVPRGRFIDAGGRSGEGSTVKKRGNLASSGRRQGIQGVGRPFGKAADCIEIRLEVGAGAMCGYGIGAGVEFIQHEAGRLASILPEIVSQIARLGPARSKHAVEQVAKLVCGTRPGIQDGDDFHGMGHSDDPC